MTEAERALRSVLDAAGRAGADEPRELAFGPIPMTVQADDSALLDQTAAHAAGEPGPGAWRPLRVVLATGRTLDRADLPAPLRPPSDHAQGTTIVRAGDLTAVVGDGMTWVVDDATGTAMRWTATAADVPIWEANRPLRVALRWWGSRHGAGLLHAAAVGRDGRALLLVGAGGAGKSTTAYSCLGRGLQVLGDDYCLVRPDDEGSVTAFATYRLGNLGERSLEMLPWLRERVLGMGHQGKAIVAMDALPPGEGRADVVGIAAVVQSPGEATRLVPHSSMGVLRRLGPNTVSQIAGWSRETLAVCTTVVTTVPTYELHVADPVSAAPVLAEHLGVHRMTVAVRDHVPVTVVIPARDAAATIASTLESVLGQSVGRPQVIVVDDGSTDDTADLARAAAPTVTVVSGSAAGPGAARNRGASQVTTEFLAFCDADDRWPPDRLEHDLAILEADPAIGILLGSMRFDADDPALIAHITFDRPDRVALMPHFGAATMRTRVFGEVGPIDETLVNYEDFEWFLRAREVPGCLVTHDRVTLWSWRHADSLSHQHPATTRDMLRLLQRQAARQRALGRDLPTLADLRREGP